MEDRCVCCGEIIPEGRQICKQCEYEQEENELKEVKLYEQRNN